MRKKTDFGRLTGAVSRTRNGSGQTNSGALPPFLARRIASPVEMLQISEIEKLTTTLSMIDTSE